MADPAPIIWFADDWARHPSSSQHLARHLLAQRQIHWVNTIGTRKPGLNLDTLSRGLEKLHHWSKAKPANELPPNLTVSNPRMWPWFTHGWDRWLNRKLLARHVRKLVAGMSRLPVIVTTLPLMADLVGKVPAERWVYYCVDDFSVWPGLDGKAMLAMEAKLVAKVDRIVAVSETLQERMKSLGRSSDLLTHGVDVEFWGEKRGHSAFSPDEWLDNCRERDGAKKQNVPFFRPFIVFWGVVDRRMDTAIIQTLAEAKLGTILLVGPHNNPDPEMLALPGVVAPGSLPLEMLPGLAQMSSVLIMPYADLPVTRAIQPLKLKEYLATGLPCVVSELPANREWADCLDIASSPEAFVAAVKRLLVEGVSEQQKQARKRLEQESWDAKAKALAEIIDGGGHG